MWRLISETHYYESREKRNSGILIGCLDEDPFRQRNDDHHLWYYDKGQTDIN